MANKSEEEEVSVWDDFFERNPFFGRITGQIKALVTQKASDNTFQASEENLAKVIQIQRFWRKATSTDTKVKISGEKVKHLAPQTQLLVNVRTNEEVKNILKTAAKKNQINTNLVHTILRQPNSMKSAYELYKENKITKAQFFRIAELHKRYGRQEHVIYKSINVVKIKKLAALIENGLTNLTDTENQDQFKELKEFFKDPTFPEIVVGLFDSNYSKNMQSQQLLTLLEMYQAQQKRIDSQSHVTQIYRILDKNGQFTAEAKKYLLPTFAEDKKSGQMRALNDNENYDRLRALVMQLPPSERIFYIATAQVIYARPLTSAVVYERAMAQVKNPDSSLNEIDGKKVGDPFIIPSCGLRNAIGILRYGVEDYVPVIPQFGIKSMEDIEKGLKTHRGRLGYLFYPRTPDPGAVHASPNDTYLGVFVHDKYHSDIVSSLPEYAKKGLSRLAAIIRSKSSMQWSEPVWTWIDADFRYFKTAEFAAQSAENIVHFCSMLDTGQPGVRPYGQIIKENQGISAVGIFVMLDMVENKEAWKDIGLDPGALPDASLTRVPKTSRTKSHIPSNYKKYFISTEAIVAKNTAILAKPPESQLLEMMVYLSLRETPSQQIMHEFGNFIDEMQKLGLLTIGKKNLVVMRAGEKVLALKFAEDYVEYDEANNQKALMGIMLMYQDYQSNKQFGQWNREDFIKAHDRSSQSVMKLYKILNNKQTGLEKIVIQTIIQKILDHTQKIYPETISFKDLHGAINTYLYPPEEISFLRSLREKTHATSDAMLRKICNDVLDFDKSKMTLSELIDEIIQYGDAVAQEQEKPPPKASGPGW